MNSPLVVSKGIPPEQGPAEYAIILARYKDVIQQINPHVCGFRVNSYMATKTRRAPCIQIYVRHEYFTTIDRRIPEILDGIRVQVIDAGTGVIESKQ